MFSLKTASLFALLGAGALAHPAKRNVVYETQVVVDTVVVATKTQYVEPGTQPTPAVAQVQVQAPAPTVTYTPAPAPPVTYTPAPAPVSASVSSEAPATSSESSDAPSYMSVVNKYRSAMGLSDLSFDSSLQNGIQQTVNNGNGQMVHAFHDDATGQVLAPAPEDNFFQAFVQGWLCEIPSLPGLGSACDSGLYNLKGQTGHADILTRTDITKIGCAFAVGIWGCDVQ